MDSSDENIYRFSSSLTDTDRIHITAHWSRSSMLKARYLGWLPFVQKSLLKTSRSFFLYWHLGGRGIIEVKLNSTTLIWFSITNDKLLLPSLQCVYCSLKLNITEMQSQTEWLCKKKITKISKPWIKYVIHQRQTGIQKSCKNTARTLKM